MRKTLAVVLLGSCLVLSPPAWGDDVHVDGPLARYVQKPDDSFRWVQRRSGKLGQADFVELILTSQSWRGSTWKHQLFVLRPPGVPAEARHALLLVGGGQWSDKLEAAAVEGEAPPRLSPLYTALAQQLKTPIAVLMQVPHQPIMGGRLEDDAIAQSFANFMQSGDPEWPLLLPMVKSVVRGMDAVQQAAAAQWQMDLQTFTVTGASKRGWTTWLTGAVDPRAVAIAPMVIDMLNTTQQMQHQVRSFGSHSEQIADYTGRGLPQHLDTPQGEALNRIVDPYQYRRQLTQPKLILLGTNDRYWPLDALNLYWDGLIGEKYVLYVPNSGHSLQDVGRVAGALAALHRRVVDGAAMPKLDWKLEGDDAGLSLELRSDIPPAQVRAWIATSPTRDFRDAAWSAHLLRRQDHDGGYRHQLPMPAQGYAAMFGEAEFDTQPSPLFLSTNVRIIGAAERVSRADAQGPGVLVLPSPSGSQ